MKKRFVSLLLCLVMLLWVIPTEALATKAPSGIQQAGLDALYVQGIPMKTWLKENPGMGYIYVDANGRTMVPLRAIIEIMGLDVVWDRKEQSITINGGLKGKVVFRIGSASYTIAGATHKMDTAPVVIEERTHMPIRFVAESVGGLVYYNGNTSGKVAEIYYHASDVTPTGPSWADGDYVTFQRTSAYLPDNWKVIIDLRSRAIKGEDVSAELEAFLKRFSFLRLSGSSDYQYYDEGINYEVLLIATQLKQNGFDMNLPGRVRTVYPFMINDLTVEQLESIHRWNLRLLGAGETEMPVALKLNLISILCPQAGGFVSAGASYDSYDPRRVSAFGANRDSFLKEKWFLKLTNKKAPDVIFFDGDCFSPNLNSLSIHKTNGVTMIDLELIGHSLSLKQGSDDYTVTSTTLKWPKKIVDSTKKVTTFQFNWKGQTITISTGSEIADVGGKKIPMGAAVEETSKGYYVPISFLTEVLGTTVQYDEGQGIYFVSSEEKVLSENLRQWTLGMSGVMSARGEGNPYYLGIYNRCIRTQRYSENSIFGSNYSYYPAYNLSKNILADSWGCYNGEDVKQQAKYLLQEADNLEHPSWNLFRVAHIASWGYSGGYLTANEALELVKPAAQKLRESYSNWDAATKDYLDGYLNWSDGDTEEYELRKDLYEQLKAEQSIYGILFDNSLFNKDVD